MGELVGHLTCGFVRWDNKSIKDRSLFKACRYIADAVVHAVWLVTVDVQIIYSLYETIGIPLSEFLPLRGNLLSRQKESETIEI